MNIAISKATDRPHIRRASAGGTGTYKGGQFLPRAIWDRERLIARDGLNGVLRSFGDRLQYLRGVYEQNAAIAHEGVTRVRLVSAADTERQMIDAIGETYLNAFRMGKRASGNLLSVTPDDMRRIGALVQDEAGFLRRFLADIAAGTGHLDYATRMDMYRGAARELYWYGWVLGDTRPGRTITWRTGPTEHCADCLKYEQHGPYSVAEFLRDVLSKGHVPQSGALECHGIRCLCEIRDSTGSPGIDMVAARELRSAAPAVSEEITPQGVGTTAPPARSTEAEPDALVLLKRQAKLAEWLNAARPEGTGMLATGPAATRVVGRLPLAQASLVRSRFGLAAPDAKAPKPQSLLALASANGVGLTEVTKQLDAARFALWALLLAWYAEKRRKDSTDAA